MKGLATLAACALLAAAQPSLHRRMVNPIDKLEYVWIPPGAFTMGCSPGDARCDVAQQPPHEVRIADGFWLGQSAVTQTAWAMVMKRAPSHNKGGQLPVESISWNDADDYCRAVGGRLPTEAEWEYAAWAGSANPRNGIDNANAFGVFDMLGTVWQWVQDPLPNKDLRIARGGSFLTGLANVRVTSRITTRSSLRSLEIGLRCAVDASSNDVSALTVRAAVQYRP